MDGVDVLKNRRKGNRNRNVRRVVTRQRGGGTRRNTPARAVTRQQSYLELRPAFPGQQVACLTIPGDPIKYTTTVTTGVIASSTSITYNLISTFTTRFAGWDEYRVTRVIFDCRVCATTNPGLIHVWVEDRSNATPTLAIAEAAEGLFFNMSAADVPHQLDYKINDQVYTDYTALSATQNIGYLNVYTNNANYGSNAVATDVLVIIPHFVIQFRGLA